jgi:hypothetical protein
VYLLQKQGYFLTTKRAYIYSATVRSKKLKTRRFASPQNPRQATRFKKKKKKKKKQKTKKQTNRQTDKNQKSSNRKVNHKNERE